MSKIIIKNLSKKFIVDNKEYMVLKDINLEIKNGEFICILGPSGCGKSTLLNILAGFITPTKGDVLIDGKKVKSPSKDRITIFQNYGLLPWRNVRKNVLLALENKRMSKIKKDNLIDKYLDIVGLSEYKEYYPKELSGGMKQRVAIARALVSNPEILFMDEPLGAIDPIVRHKLQKDIKNIWEKENKTIVFVTHDVEEAIFLGTKIVIMSSKPGEIIEVMDNNHNKKSSDFYLKKDRIFKLLKDSSQEKIEYYI